MTRFVCKVFWICGAILYSTSLYAQNEVQSPLMADFNTCTYFGGGKHSAGWSANFRHARSITPNRYRLIDIDILSMKHPKEIKVVNPFFDNPRPYVYGKLNRDMLIRAGIGLRHQIGERMDKNGLAVNVNGVVGPVFAVLKPVYLDIVHMDSVSQSLYYEPEKFNPAEPPSQNAIYGYSSFRYGLDELRIRVGAFAKASFSFEWGNFSDDLKAVEAGVAVDYFPSNLPIMAYIRNKYVYTTVFITFSFGNKN